MGYWQVWASTRPCSSIFSQRKPGRAPWAFGRDVPITNSEMCSVPMKPRTKQENKYIEEHSTTRSVDCCFFPFLFHHLTLWGIVQVSFIGYWAKRGPMMWIVILQLAFLPLQQHQSIWSNMTYVFLHCSSPKVLGRLLGVAGRGRGILLNECIFVVHSAPTFSPTAAPPKYLIEHATGRYCSSDIGQAEYGCMSVSFKSSAFWLGPKRAPWCEKSSWN